MARPAGDVHDGLVRDWAAHAVAREEPHRRFLRSLKMVDEPQAIDVLAQELHREVFAQIDCTRCANCCKTATPAVDDADIDRMAAWLKLPRAEFIAAYLAAYPAEGRYHMNALPCPFLGDDDRCAIYEVRPASCRGYPYTDQTGFTTRAYLHTSNTVTCPAVYHIVKEMCKRIS